MIILSVDPCSNGSFLVLVAAAFTVLSVMVIACIAIIIILSVVLIKIRQRKEQSDNYGNLLSNFISSCLQNYFPIIAVTSDRVIQANLAYDTVKTK